MIMTKEDQIRFITEILDSCKYSLIEKIEKGHIPEKWNGKELRHWIADYFKANLAYKPLDRKEKSEYRNDLLINPNLI